VVTKIAMGGLLAILAVGAWLITAPFVVHFQRPGAPWTGPARMDVAVGAIVAAAGLVGFFAALAGQIRGLYARTGSERRDLTAGIGS
jgi:hypothetical protein